MLRDSVISCIQDFVMHRVSQFIEATKDHGKRVTAIVVDETHNVLKKKCCGTFLFKYSEYVIEERALSLVLKALALPDGTERLAWKPGQQHLKIGNFRRLDFGDVSMRSFFEVCFVGFFGILIPLRGEHALPANCLKSKSSTANPGE